MVLNHYRVELRSGGPGTLRGKCPLPMHGSKESRASFNATLTKGVGGVWACQSASCIKARDGKRGGNALDFVATMESCSVREAAEKMSEWFGIARSGAPTVRGTSNIAPQSVSKERRDSGANINKPLAFTLQGVEFKHPYLASRGVDEATARKFGIGYFPGRGTMQGRVVIPIHNAEGELVAYAGRAIDGTEPKYKLPAGFKKGLELFNVHRVLSDGNAPRWVVVVEGFFDCVAVTAGGFACVALMGCSMSEAQEELLARYFKGVCLLLDGDDAGRKATDELLLRLGGRLWVHAAVLTDGAQPDALALEEIRNALS
jgi:DNA primase